MSRDPEKPRVFRRADLLVIEVYRVTSGFPSAERFGLQAQIRRAALSVASNIAEGAGRRSRKEYAHFLNVANGSAFEVRYLLTVTHRLGHLTAPERSTMTHDYTELSKGLQRLITSVHPPAEGF